MRAFVTGGTGFVGSHLVRALQQAGHEVRCLARSRHKVEEVFPDRPPGIVSGNLQDASALERGCAGADVVYHVAGLIAARSAAEFRAVNINATTALCKIAARTSPDLAHFVYVSSLAAAGPSTATVPLDDDVRPQPVSDYGWSKLGGEEAVRGSRLPWTIVRPPAVYGPRDREFLKVFKLAKRGVAPVFAGGAQRLSFVYGPDLANALVAVASPAAVERTYCAAHPEIVTARDFSVRVYRAVTGSDGAPMVVSIPAPIARAVLTLTGAGARLLRRATLLSGDKANELLAEAWTCQPDRIRQDVAWSAETNLERGLADTAAWYRETGWL